MSEECRAPLDEYKFLLASKDNLLSALHNNGTTPDVIEKLGETERELDFVASHPEVKLASVASLLEQAKKLIEIRGVIRLRDSEKIDGVLQPLSDATILLSDCIALLRGDTDLYDMYVQDLKQAYLNLEEIFNQINTPDFQKSMFGELSGHKEAETSQEAMIVEYLGIIRSRLLKMKKFIHKIKSTK